MLWIVFGIMLTLHPGSVQGQSDPIKVENADTFRGTGVDEEIHFIGHVRIIHGETTLTSDRVRYRRTKGELTLDGNVQIARYQTTLNAEHVVYFEQDRRIEADGAVQLIDEEEGTTLTGEKGVYRHRPRHAILTGSPKLVRTQGNDNIIISGRVLEYFFSETDSLKRAVVQDSVTVLDLTEQITVTCQRVEYTRNPEWALLSGHPRLVKQQEGDMDNILVTGKYMAYAFIDKHADVYDSVTITRGSIYGVCDSLSYDSKMQNAYLTGHPTLREGNSELSGDNIVLELSNDALTRANITGNAVGTYAPDDSSLTDSVDSRPSLQKSIIQGRTLKVLFDEDMVREIVASQNAMSTYRPDPSGSKDLPGSNEVQASRIIITLDQGELLQVHAEGSVTGTYKPGRER